MPKIGYTKSRAHRSVNSLEERPWGDRRQWLVGSVCSAILS